MASQTNQLVVNVTLLLILFCKTALTGQSNKTSNNGPSRTGNKMYLNLLYIWIGRINEIMHHRPISFLACHHSFEIYLEKNVQ
jgi:hypothetical protein